MSKKNNKNVDITNAFLNNWHPDNFEKKYIYIRDAKVNCLLCCFSRKGMHSWAYDYVKKGTHKSKVFGYYPAISIKQARKKALEIQIQVVDEDKDYFYNYGQDCEFMVQQDYKNQQKGATNLTNLTLDNQINS